MSKVRWIKLSVNSFYQNYNAKNPFALFTGNFMKEFLPVVYEVASKMVELCRVCPEF